MEKINGGTLESFIKKRKNGAQKTLVKPSNNLADMANSADSSPTIRYRDKVIPEQVAASITKDICNGLSHIHIKNFIHRDMKPENILIDEKYNEDGTQPDNPQERYSAKIADFGLSAEVHSNVFHGQDNINEIMGTILFMAPEQATG